MTTRRTPAIAAAVALAATAALLTGCTATGPAITSQPSQSASPTATPVAATPDSLLPLSCADIAADNAVQDLFAEPVSLVSRPAKMSSDKSPGLYRAAIDGAGGIQCSWSTTPADENSDGLTVSVLPKAGDSWSKSAFPYTVPGQITCRNTYCGFDQLLDEYWVSVTAQASSLDAAAGSPLSRLIDVVVTTVSALGPSAAPAVQPRSCSDLGREQVTVLYGIDLDFTEGYEEPRALDRAGMIGAGHSLCQWRLPRASGDGLSEDSISVETMRAPVWATPSAIENSWIATPAEPLKVDSFKPGEFAFLHCQASCVADVIVAGTWTRIVTPGAPTTSVDPRDAATELVIEAVSRIHTAR